jgi:hypothetical protein
MEARRADFQQLWELDSPETVEALRPTLGGLIGEILLAVAQDSVVYDQVPGLIFRINSAALPRIVFRALERAVDPP